MAHAETDGDVIWVTTVWTEKELVKLVPGTTWDAEARRWRAPLAWSTCVTLRGVFQTQLTLGDRLREWAWAERRARVEPATALRLLTEPAADDVDLRGLYPFQAVDTEFLDVAGDALLGNEMGTGKTIALLVALRDRGAAGLPALVICPNSVKVAWAREAARWLPDAFPVVVDGSAAVKRKILTGPARRADALVIINVEAVRLHSRLAGYGSLRLKRCRECDPRHGDPQLPASRCEVHRKELNELDLRTVIIDEAHRIKDPTSKQTRACWAVGHGPTVTRRWAATGTPVANGPDDLWSLMHFVDPTEYRARSRFVDRYCLMSWNAYGGTSVVGLNPATRDEFYAIFDPRFRAMPKALVLTQLPPKVYEQRVVEMTPKQRAAYVELAKNSVTRLDTGELLVAPNDLVTQVRLSQLASSYCTIEVDADGASHVRLAEPSPKVDELVEILADLEGHQVAVSAPSRQLIELAAARLTKLRVPHSKIVGGMSGWDRDAELERFQSGRSRVMLFTLQAGGTGLTMTAADTLVRLQRSWSMIDNYQGEDRVHRIGSEIHESVTIIDLVTRGTVEETVQLPRLLDKSRRLEEIKRTRATLLAGAGYDPARGAAATAELDDEESRILSSNLGWSV